MADLPTIMTAAGLQPTAPVDLRKRLTDAVAATNPGYTADLPGTLIEDIASTDVGALVQADQFRVELINSLTPHGANEFLLAQLGAIYGVPLGAPTNTTVQVQFTGDAGFVVPPGFTVSDGTYQYVVRDGGVVGASGTGNLTAVANQTGEWPVPAGTVTQIVTSVPSGVTLAVNNLLAGSPGLPAPSMTEYRAAVLRAGLAASQGMLRTLKTALRNVTGVQERLISARAVRDGWQILVGGSGDNYQVAGAIFNALLDLTSLRASVIAVTGISQANPGVVTTDIKHLLTTGQVITITGIAGMTALNGVPLTVTVVDPHTFTVGIDTSIYPAWASGGEVSPNARNVQVHINDYPDKYLVPFVVPALQPVHITATWNTSALNFVGGATIAALTSPALVAYINAIPAGQPIIVYELENAFRDAVSAVLPPQLLTRMVFAVSIDGVGVDPEAGTGVIAGDPESYFLISETDVTVTQG